MAPLASHQSVRLDNLENGETVHQRCISLRGACINPTSEIEQGDQYISISTTDESGETSFPVQKWPCAQSRFKALVFLAPGQNTLNLWHGDAQSLKPRLQIQIIYIPLLQNPPLHLAVLVAKDSPLLIDCPPAKHCGISSAHSSLEAAIAKFRMTAYMWQAFTAEDLRSKGLGRRAFRLEEEWIADTVSQQFQEAITEDTLWNGPMRSSAKVHIVPCDKSVAELRDAQVAQQNPNARRKNDLHDYFTTALKKYGGPFTSSARPVIAGLILDSHYSMQQNLILGHAALGCCNPDGISLGMFGSHLTYSWPRFIEEVTSTLLDTRSPGDNVGNDNDECGSMWEACAIGQGAFLHEVGHAFGSPHTTGIMARGYAQHWPRNFLERTAFCSCTKEPPIHVSDYGVENNATWDIQDALSYTTLPHFKVPSDPILQAHEKSAVPTIEVLDEDEDFPRILIKGTVGGIARVRLNNVEKGNIAITTPRKEIYYTVAELEDLTDPPRSTLKIEVLGMNGKVKIVGNVWKLLATKSYVRIPGSDQRLQKQSISSNYSEEECRPEGPWEWAVMLKKQGVDGQLVRASCIDLRVGCILDGAVLHYEDRTKVNLGPVWGPGGETHTFGGHASQKLYIPSGHEIEKVEINYDQNGWGCLEGIRMHLSHQGLATGELNEGAREHVSTLEPAAGDRIVGFYGKSQYHSGFCIEFGIITAPKDLDLPVEVYDLPELQNTDGGTGPRPANRGDSEMRDDEDDE